MWFGAGQGISCCKMPADQINLKQPVPAFVRKTRQVAGRRSHVGNFIWKFLLRLGEKYGTRTNDSTMTVVLESVLSIHCV